MAILTTTEKAFFDVFLHEATAPPFFNGPATKELYAIGLEYRDLSYLAWAYEQEVPKTEFGWGHAADTAPPLPWPSRDAAIRRNKEVQQVWEKQREPAYHDAEDCRL